MKRILFTVLLLGLSPLAQADTLHMQTLRNMTSALSEVDAQAFNWKQGDQAQYNIKMGFVSGKMSMEITQIDASQMTMSMNIDLGFLGKQDCQTVIDITNGATKSIVCNGQNQQPPNRDDIEIVDQTADRVTVPAGDFDCLKITMKQKSDGKEINQWINPKLVPIMGLIKSVAPGPMGNVETLLASFKKN